MKNKMIAAVKTRWVKPVFFLSLALGLLLSINHSGDAMEDGSEKQRVEYYKAFQLYQNKCLSCHDSVADPEKPAKTRDEWYVVINVMHEYGLDLTLEEKEKITDLLYDLRKKPADFY